MIWVGSNSLIKRKKTPNEHTVLKKESVLLIHLINCLSGGLPAYVFSIHLIFQMNHYNGYFR